MDATTVTTCSAFGRGECSPPPSKMKQVIKSRGKAINEFGLCLGPDDKVYLCSTHYNKMMGLPPPDLSILPPPPPTVYEEPNSPGRKEDKKDKKKMLARKNSGGSVGKNAVRTVVVMRRLERPKQKMLELPSELLEDMSKSVEFQNHLTFVDLSNNKLRVIPEELFKCVNIQNLIIHHNQIEEIPDSLTFNMYKLEELDASFNKISKLPWDWTNMISLTSLNLESNKIDFMPIPIGNLNIKILELSDNKLEAMYRELLDTRALAYIRGQKTMPKAYLQKKKDASALRKSMDVQRDTTPQTQNFRSLLEHKAAVEDLLAFQKSEFSHENLWFIVTTYRYRARYPAFNPIRTQELVDEAQGIYDRFISEESPTMINISADVRDNIEKHFAKNDIHQHIFNEALEQTIIGTAADPFRRFLASPNGPKWANKESYPKSAVRGRQWLVNEQEWGEFNKKAEAK